MALSQTRTACLKACVETWHADTLDIAQPLSRMEQREDVFSPRASVLISGHLSASFFPPALNVDDKFSAL